MAPKTKLSQELTKFEGVFCSGFYIPDQAIVTALALLFDKVHFLNQLEYVIELSKRYRIDVPAVDVSTELTSIDKDATDNPLAELSPEQRKTVDSYLYLSNGFFLRNANLIPKVFTCSLFPDDEVWDVTLIKEGKEGENNTYRVTPRQLVVTTEAEDELTKLLRQGCVPILGGLVPTRAGTEKNFPASQIATALAIKTVTMVLPGTRAAHSDDILEARERLSDHLPLFWSTMLKLSADLSERLQKNMTEEKLQQEVDHAVATIVRPSLVEVVKKLEMESKLWFHRILSPLGSGLRLLAGSPPTDIAGLVSQSMMLGTDVATDLASHFRKVDTLKQDSGLTYIIELHKIVEGQAEKSKS